MQLTFSRTWKENPHVYTEKSQIHSRYPHRSNTLYLSTSCEFITSLEHRTSISQETPIVSLNIKQSGRAGAVTKSDVNIFQSGTSQQKLNKREAKLGRFHKSTMKSSIFCAITPCNPAKGKWRFGSHTSLTCSHVSYWALLFDPAYGGHTFLQYSGSCSPHCTLLHAGRQNPTVSCHNFPPIKTNPSAFNGSMYDSIERTKPISKWPQSIQTFAFRVP